MLHLFTKRDTSDDHSYLHGKRESRDHAKGELVFVIQIQYLRRRGSIGAGSSMSTALIMPLCQPSIDNRGTSTGRGLADFPRLSIKGQPAEQSQNICIRREYRGGRRWLIDSRNTASSKRMWNLRRLCAQADISWTSGATLNATRGFVSERPSVDGKTGHTLCRGTLSATLPIRT